MRAFLRPGLAVLMAIAVVAVAPRAQGQAPAARAKGEAAPGKAAGAVRPAPINPALLKQVLATVNGQPITRGELLDFLSQYPIPPDDNREMVYRDAVDTLVNTRLVTQYLDRLKINVTEAQIDEAVSHLDKQMKAEGTSLATSLSEANKPMAEVRKVLADRIRWVEFVKQRATDAELKKFAEAHKDLLNGTQVRASHILLQVTPTATAADKAQVRQKLDGIKRDIESKKYTFAQAANKFSEDPANSEGAGGDIGYFGLGSGIIEEFGQVAFALKPGQMTGPVETPYGFHLIMVTDRKEGTPINFEQNRPQILNAYAAELQKQILTAQRKTAKVDVKPMPPDLFPSLPAPAEPPAQPKAAAPAAK